MSGRINFWISSLILATLLNYALYFARAQSDPGDALFLTPLIKEGKVKEAVELSLVKEFPIESYSAFITVNESYNSNLFFWYIPAENATLDSEEPVILWNDGGPGQSCMLSVFGLNGPFVGNPSGDGYTLNPFSWHKKYHMIFIDNPVEVGFSFTSHEHGYIRSADEAAVHMYEFLTQFFTMFPHLQKNKFYTSGVSYGGKYSIVTAHYIHQQNLGQPDVRVNLAGNIGDSPWYDSYTQIIYGKVLFNAGLISTKQLEYFEEREQYIINMMDQGNYEDGAWAWAILTSEDTENRTGFSAIYNVNDDIQYKVNMESFVTNNSTRKAIHVGSRKYIWRSQEQQLRMVLDLIRPVKDKLEAVLNAGYKFMVLLGNMDVITGHVGIQRMIKTLNWPSAMELIDGPRTIWTDKGGVAGYVTSTKNNNATVVVFRNAGHAIALLQPERMLQAVEKFIDGENSW